MGEYNTQRRKSKISLKFDELQNEIKEYDKLVKEEILDDDYDKNSDDDYDEMSNEDKFEYSHYLDNSANNYFQNFKKFKIYCYFKINKENEYIFPIESDSLNIKTQYRYELIKNIVKKVNENIIIINHNSNKYILSLKDCEEENNKEFYINNYELRPCKKKNFSPKFDLPNYSSTLLLKDISNETISFVSKNQSNIMLIENYDISEKKYYIEENDFYLDKNLENSFSFNNKNKSNKKIQRKTCLNCLII